MESSFKKHWAPKMKYNYRSKVEAIPIIAHYEWDENEQDSAICTLNLMTLVKKLGIGYQGIMSTQSDKDGSITVSVIYKP